MVYDSNPGVKMFSVCTGTVIYNLFTLMEHYNLFILMDSPEMPGIITL